MADLLPTPEDEMIVSPRAKGPIIEKAAQDQLARQRVRVDPWSVEPKKSPSEP